MTAACPACDADLGGTMTRGPSEIYAWPCGCRVSEYSLREVAQ